MKKILALMLILCMCVTMLASCDIIDSLGGEKSDDEAGNSENTDKKDGGKDSGDNMKGFPDVSDAEKINGEKITERDFEKMIDGYSNFTVTVEALYGTVIYAENIKVDGDVCVCYEYEGKELLYGAATFKIDSELVYCIYDVEKKAWEVEGDGLFSVEYPFMNFSVSYDELEYDAQSGSYFVDGVELDGATYDAEFRFRDGKPVYVSLQEQTDRSDRMTFAFSDYGTTKVVTPKDEELIYDKSDAGEEDPDGGKTETDKNEGSGNTNAGDDIHENGKPYDPNSGKLPDGKYDSVGSANNWDFIFRRDCTFDNYSYDTDRVYGGEYFSMSFRRAGDKFYKIEKTDSGESVFCGFDDGGDQTVYMRDRSTGSWAKASYAVDLTHPLSVMAFNYSDFKQDSVSGIYYGTMETEGVTAEIAIGFYDGHVDFVEISQDGEDGKSSVRVRFYDYEETWVDLPNEVVQDGSNGKDESVSGGFETDTDDRTDTDKGYETVFPNVSDREEADVDSSIAVVTPGSTGGHLTVLPGLVGGNNYTDKITPYNSTAK